jgi:hypothetical protein
MLINADKTLAYHENHLRSSAFLCGFHLRITYHEILDEKPDGSPR